MSKAIAKSEWEWFGNAAHFVCGNDCRFHLATKIGDIVVSTVGEYVPDAPVRDILAGCRDIVLKGKGDARMASWMNENGYEEIGVDRTYETMVFRVNGECRCGCGLPNIDSSDLDFVGYNHAIEATKGHHAMCAKWAVPSNGEEDGK